MRRWCRSCLLLLFVLCACHPPSHLRGEAVSVLREVLVSGPAGARVAAIETAERYDVGQLFDPVSRLLDHDDERVRTAAAAATLRAHVDAPIVLRAMLHAGDPVARAMAVAALGRRVGQAAREDLTAALSDGDAGVRQTAIAAVAPFVEPTTLVRLAREDPSGAVRARALMSLKKDGLDAARAGLTDPYLGARLAAAELLVRLGARGELAASSDPFVRLIADRAAAVREAAAAKDAGLRAAAAIAVVTEVEVARALARDPQPVVRLAAGRALIRAGSVAEGHEVLALGLGLPDVALRLGAAADLAADGDDRGARVIAELAANEDAGVRLAAMRALPRRGRVPDVLEAGLRDRSPDVRVVAAEKVLERD